MRLQMLWYCSVVPTAAGSLDKSSESMVVWLKELGRGMVQSFVFSWEAFFRVHDESTVSV